MPGLPVRSPCSPLCVCASLSDHCSPAVHSAPRRSRTPSLLIRSQTLYPVELWALGWRIVNRLRCTDAQGRTVEQRQVGLFSARSLVLIQAVLPCASIASLTVGCSPASPQVGGTRFELVTSTMST